MQKSSWSNKKRLFVLTIFLLVGLSLFLNLNRASLEKFSIFHEENNFSAPSNQKLDENSYNIMIAGSSHSLCNYLEKSPTNLLNLTKINFLNREITFNVANFASGGALAPVFIETIAPNNNLSIYDYIVLEYSTRATLDTLENFEIQMNEIVDLVVNAGAIPILQTSIYLDFPDHHSWDRNAGLNPYNQFLRDLADERQIPLVDIASRFKNEIDNGNWDLFIRNDDDPVGSIEYFTNAHPNEVGQHYIYEEILQTILLDIFPSHSFYEIMEQNLHLKIEPSTLQLISNSISIYNNDDWSTYQELLDISGSGSSSDPYIIENFLFKSTSDDTFIINQSSANFIIRNCAFIGDDKYESGYAIKIINSSNGQIYNNQFSGLRVGCFIENSFNFSIFQNNFTSNFEVAIWLYQCEAINISKNILQNNSLGIRSYFTRNTVLELNNITNNFISGIDSVYCCNVEFLDNILIHNPYGLNYYEINEINSKMNVIFASIFGVVAVNINQSKFTDNVIINCSIGFKFWNYQKISQDNFLKSNIFYKNYFGLDIQKVPYVNLVSQNLFVLNNFSSFSLSSDFKFDNGSIGNFYTDIENYYDGDMDGINDYIYNIPPEGDSVDHYPIYFTETEFHALIDQINFYIEKFISPTKLYDNSIDKDDIPIDNPLNKNIPSFGIIGLFSITLVVLFKKKVNLVKKINTT